MKHLRWGRTPTVLLIIAGLSLTGAGCDRSQQKGSAPDEDQPQATRRAKAKNGAGTKRGSEGNAAEGSSGATINANRAAPDPPQRIVRPTLKVPTYDEQRIADLGIRRYESKHMVLYTDLAPEIARELPPVMDQAYAAWEEYFGPLPPDLEGNTFQMIGHIMTDRERFRDAGILNEEVPNFAHGINRRQLFWMMEHPSDYYRRHLMLHEGTHCFMMALPNPTNRYVWYMEGMAELFGTHALDAGGRASFRVMPPRREAVEGLGRILLVESEDREKGPRTIAEVTCLEPGDYFKNDAYAWSWALCAFLDGHPRYRERFRRAGSVVTSGGSEQIDLGQTFQSDWDELSEEWLVAAGNLCHGYDIERTVLDLAPGKPLAGSGGAARIDVVADHGWQSSGIRVERGKRYRIVGTGRFVLANEPRPWESEPQGVSIRYHAGLPLGMLVATIRSVPPPAKRPHTTMLDVLPIGRERVIEPAVSGTLYLRVNDFWNELADNSGRVQVTIDEVGGG